MSDLALLVERPVLDTQSIRVILEKTHEGDCI
jgi:hypothetical protein